MDIHGEGLKKRGITRRDFIRAGMVGGLIGVSGAAGMRFLWRMKADTFIAKAESYNVDLASVIFSALVELGITNREIKGKRILLKPNLVEVLQGTEHINTHPLVVRGAVEAFLYLGAAGVIVGEGQGHVRDSYYVLEESGLGEVLYEDRIRFVDLNNDNLIKVQNKGRLTRMKHLSLPASLAQVDIIVSMAKLKTHHWAGVTLSMKNMFGVMPGIVYGWPKNVLHVEGIEKSILDINATVKPHLAIVDGIVGMEGDGPIMGTPRHAGVLIMGRNLLAVDATCARVMGIDPHKVRYLEAASDWLGPVDDTQIAQRGERIDSAQKSFKLQKEIPAQKNIRLV